MQTKERNLTRLFPQLQEYFSPKIVGEVNDVFIKITKVKGDAVPWHIHDNEDEMFYMVKGSLVMELKDQESFELKEGEFFIVKKGLEHRVHSREECWILLIENKATKHTGDVKSGITKSVEEQY
jgi:mannose-6-phosphate isomerase-like protein (cupin superfamily)